MARYVWLLILLISGILRAQPAVQWEEVITNVELNWVRCMTQTADGGYFIGGCSAFSPPGIIYKLTSTGISVRVRHYSEMSDVRSVVPTRDGGFVWTNYWGLNMMKTDNGGVALWSHQWSQENPPDSIWYTYGNIQPLAGGGFILSGGCLNRFETWHPVGWIYLMKVAENGDSLWLRTYRNQIVCDSARVVQAADGGFLLFGQTQIQTVSDTALAMATKVDADGNLLWSHTYGESSGRIIAAKPMADGGFLLAGERHVAGIDSVHLLLIRMNHLGDTLWTRDIVDGRMLIPLRMISTWDGSSIIASQQWDGGVSAWQFWLGKISDDGDLVWSTGFPHVPYEFSVAVIQTADGGYLAAGPNDGTGNGTAYVVKLASDTPPGRMALNPTSLRFTMHQQDDSVSMPLIVQSIGSHPLRIASLATTPSWYTLNTRGPFWLDPGTDTTIWVTCHRWTGPGDLTGGLLICSNDSLSGRGAYGMTLEVNMVGGSDSEPSELPTSYQLFSNYPNPFNPTTTIDFDLPKTEFVSLNVFDLLGREVASLCNETVSAGHHTFSFDGSALTSGLYFYRIEAGDFSATNRMLLLK